MNNNMKARKEEVDERERMGIDGSLVNSQLKHSEFGREGEMEQFCFCDKEGFQP
jgi:hypothetical protein